MANFLNRDIISIKDFTKEEILHVLKIAKGFKQKPAGQPLAGKVMASLFFEPSTRTKLSFDTAMKRLGGEVIGFADPSTTSVKKGETLQDSIRTVANYADVIVMRHPRDGAARLASEVTDKPIINAGDGGNQHPSQTLLDLFTINECQGKIDNLDIALMGDLKYGRGIHSLVEGLSHFKVMIHFVAPDAIQIPEPFCKILKEKGIKYSFHANIDKIINKIDILYLTRIQEERYLDKYEYEKVKNAFYLKAQQLQNVKPTMKILHIMPRVHEMETSIDKTKYAYYFQQAGNGLYVRQTILALVFGAIK